MPPWTAALSVPSRRGSSSLPQIFPPVSRPSTFLSPRDRGRRGARGRRPRMRRGRRGGRGIRRGSPPRSTGSSPASSRRAESGTEKVLGFAGDREIFRLAKHHEVKQHAIRRAFVALHVGSRIVAPPHPAAAHAAIALHRGEQPLDHRAQLVHTRRIHLVVDVVIQTGMTASSSPPALSTTTPPLNSWPGSSSAPAGACSCTMRRFTWPRYWARATISWPG